MKYLFALLVFPFLVILVYQIACGFPLISKFRQKKRQRRWNERLKMKEDNEAKIKLLDKKLRDKGDIEKYVALNKFSLPEDEKWKTLLPKMIEDLLAIGWTTELPVYSKFKYGYYEFHISTSDQNVIDSSTPVFHKYLDLYRELDTNETNA